MQAYLSGTQLRMQFLVTGEGYRSMIVENHDKIAFIQLR